MVQLILRGQKLQTLVSTADDWQAIGEAAARMLFWCGGSVLGCRCEGPEIRLVIQRAHASLGAMAHHITAAYAARLRQRRHWKGSVFKHYLANPLADDVALEDLILWLHRSSDHVHWTADAAYLTPPALPWIDTAPLFDRLHRMGGDALALYRRRKDQTIPPRIIRAMARRPSKAQQTTAKPERPNLDTIVRFVARYCRVPLAHMHSSSRKREVSKAKLIATVLSTRNGGSVAAAARVFGRSRSTLIERAEHYRRVLPEIFSDAQTAFDAFLGELPSRSQ